MRTKKELVKNFIETNHIKHIELESYQCFICGDDDNTAQGYCWTGQSPAEYIKKPINICMSCFTALKIYYDESEKNEK